MEDSFIGAVQDILSYLRGLPIYHDHSDKLIVIAGLLLIIYFVGSMIRNLARRSPDYFRSMGVSLSGCWLFPARQSLYRRCL